MDGSFVFDLGAFDAGFTPTVANTAQWTAKWHSAQRVFYNPATRFFTGTHVVTSNASPFGTSQRGYIWGYNCAVQPAEWILISAASWTWPSSDGLGLPVDWTVGGGTAIVGQINGAGFHMKSAAVTGSLPPKFPATLWRQARFTTLELADANISGWNADPDKDGLPNLAEYALGKDPKSTASTWVATPLLHTNGAQKYLKLSISKCAYSEALLSVEASSGLQTWTFAGAVEILTDNDALLEARDLTAVGSTARRFLRLRASLP